MKNQQFDEYLKDHPITINDNEAKKPKSERTISVGAAHLRYAAERSNLLDQFLKIQEQESKDA